MNKINIFLALSSFAFSLEATAQRGLIEFVEESESIEGQSIYIKNRDNYLELMCINRRIKIETNLRGKDDAPITASIDDEKYVFGSWQNNYRKTLDIKRSGLESLSVKLDGIRILSFETPTKINVFRFNGINRNWISSCYTGTTERRFVKYAPADKSSKKKSNSRHQKKKVITPMQSGDTQKIRSELDQIKQIEQRLIKDLNINSIKNELKQLDKELIDD